MIDFLKSKDAAVRWGFFLILLAAFLFINFPFLMPFLIAGVFALGLHDFVERLGKKLKIKRKPSIAITLFAGFAIFWIPISLAIYRLISYISQPEVIKTDKLVNQIHDLKDLILGYLQKISNWTGTDIATPARDMANSLIRKSGEIVFQYSTDILAQLPSIFLASFVFVITLALLLSKAQAIKEFVFKYSLVKPELTDSLIDVAKRSCSVTLFSTLVIGLIQAGIIGLGSLIFGEGDFWLVLTLTFFVSFIPVIGAAPIGYLLAILAFIGGRTGNGIGLVVIATIAGSIDNVLKPFMVGKENKISAVIGFTCVVGAIIMIGLPGLLIGPVVMNLFAGLSPLLLKREDPELI
ncbi:MAG: hypothetical protein OM95_16035 [Bdellovibrio sp. ArHS]|uniref:AI-2E family transporter n=1 Tax=Bdellovibrio sp. ArHS TaxID=1569284 RepID=UPI000582DC86|nr:AI-2E family transporter [Bdellovibrio sp. ArHS]KHD87137.1 MAG: hypothetical protein OM95_16035 [Bdellovibrio sp. ArHS]